MIPCDHSDDKISAAWRPDGLKWTYVCRCGTRVDRPAHPTRVRNRLHAEGGKGGAA